MSSLQLGELGSEWASVLAPWSGGTSWMSRREDRRKAKEQRKALQAEAGLVRTGEGVAEQVDVIVQDHQLAGLELGVDGPRGVGQDERVNPHAAEDSHGEDHVVEGVTRIIFGLFKKFVLADSLAIIALNSTNALQVKSFVWLWILLYSYTAQIYLDFSGYTDIAIGIGRLAGIELPENFDRPYLKPNIVAFWNSWHITMAKWFRAYYFNPLTRFFLRSKHKLLPWMAIFLAQLSTMALIGLWHGVTWNFLVWGIWHGIGLYIHNRWVAFLKARSHVLPSSLFSNRGLKAASVLLTFHFVSIGWVWFALPEIGLSMTVLGRLFGM